MMRLARIGCMVLLTLWLLAGEARAQPALALAELRGQLDLREQVALLHDRGGQRTLADVRDQRFVPHDGGALSFGFDDAALWLRFALHNERAHSVPWVLEVGEPSLDHVDLYVLHDDGRTEHFRGGDALPFAERAIRHVNPSFALEAPAHDRATIFVRVQSDDVLRAPLRAFLPDAYRRQHERDALFTVLCVGALLLVAFYHVGVYLTVRQLENAWFALVSLALTSVLLSLGGQFGQFVLEHQPSLANRLPPVCLSLALMTVAFYCWATTDRPVTAELSRWLYRVGLATIPLLAFSLLAPPGLGLRVNAALLLGLAVAGPYILFLLRQFDIPELYWYRLAWYGLIGAVPSAVLRYAAIFPDNALTHAVLGLGLVAYALMNTIALAALANRLRVEVADMNERLVGNVEQLEQALQRAEDANEAARRATKAKDEFVATMSHELRTPLNTIINIPQGMLGEFEHERAAHCSQCGAAYLLDDSDLLGGDTRCERCAQVGTLIEGVKVRYRGDATRALRFLRKIERSGQHLLQLVNGVLDYSKLEANRLQLALGEVQLDALVREVIAQMSDLAQREDVRLRVQPGGRTLLEADGPRLKQVLLNLVANAIKFSPAGTTVTVRWFDADDGLRIEVADQGIGIAPADHARIFTSFEQVHKGDTRKYGGTGLGLSIARALTRMHGGELSVRSALGEGATFTLHLPRARAVGRAS